MNAIPFDADAAKESVHKHHLFSALTDSQLNTVINSANVISLRTGQSLFEQGKQANHFYLLRSGQIKLYRLSAKGDEKVIEIIYPQQSFAEALMFMEKRLYPVNAEAIVTSEVWSFDSDSFIQILRQSTDTCFRLMSDMSIKLHHRLIEIDQLTLQTATVRLIGFLLQGIANNCNNEHDVHLDLPKYIIASRLSIKPETLSRILHNLCKDGVINIKGNIVHINNIEHLRNKI